MRSPITRADLNAVDIEFMRISISTTPSWLQWVMGWWKKENENKKQEKQK
jgi:hypothetical protein